MDINPVSVCNILKELVIKEFPNFSDLVSTDTEKLIADELLKNLKEYMFEYEINEDQELLQGKLLENL